MRKDKAEESVKPERAGPEAQAPFDRFAEFARKVVAVPKREADKQEKKYRRKKVQSRSAR